MVAWTQITANGRDIQVARFDPAGNGGLGAWVALGTSLDAGGISGTGSADTAQIVNTPAGPVVAWLDSSSGAAQVYARLFTADAGRRLGAGGASGGGISNAAVSVEDLALATDGTKIAVAWTQTAGGAGKSTSANTAAGPGTNWAAARRAAG